MAGRERCSRCGFGAAAAAALQWQAVDGAFVPSLSPLPSPRLSHFGCRHRHCDSDRFAWNEPFCSVHGGVGREAGMQRAAVRCSRRPDAPSAILFFFILFYSSYYLGRRNISTNIFSGEKPTSAEWMHLDRC